MTGIESRSPLLLSALSHAGKRGTRALIGLVAVVVLVAGACSGEPTVTTAGTSKPTTAPTTAPIPTTAPPPTYPGRLLVVDDSSGTTSRVKQLTAASFDLRDATDIPTVDGTFIGGSADGTRFLVGNNNTVSVVGSDINENLADVSGSDSPALSPDGKLLAYVQIIDKDPTLVVYDLAARSSHTLLQTPCANYDSGKVCGAVAGAVWVDATTLFVTHFSGDFPKIISCSPGEPIVCLPVKANTYSIVTADGRTVADMPLGLANTQGPVSARGNTVIVAGGDWLDLEEMRAGTATARPLPDRVEMSSLSPDGTKVVVPSDTSWQLVDLRTGDVQHLGTSSTPSEADNWNSALVKWSPDGQFFAVQSSLEILIVPTSSATGGTAGTTQGQLIAWTP